MHIREITKEQYTSINPGVYASSKWLDLYDEELKVYGVFSKSDQLIGGFAYIEERRLSYFKLYRNPPYNPTIYLNATFRTKNKAKLQSEQKKLMDAVATFFDKAPGHVVAVCLPPGYTDMQPFIWKGFKVIPSYTYVIDLKRDFSALEKDFSSDRRYDIKKAIKDGVSCERTEDYEQVKKLVINTFDRKKMGVNMKMLDRILFQFADKDNSFAYVSSLDGNAIAASFFIHDKERVYYLLGGYHQQLKHSGAGALSLYHALQHSQSLGLSEFDFEGSMLPEVEHYFRGFGGDMKTYYSINKAKLWLEFGLKLIDRSKF